MGPTSHIKHMTYTESQHRIYTYVRVYDPTSYTIFEGDNLLVSSEVQVFEMDGQPNNIMKTKDHITIACIPQLIW